MSTTNLLNPENPSQLYTDLTTIKKLGKDVSMTDSDENLKMYSYTNNDDSSRNFQGVIFNKNKLVLEECPYTVEYSQTTDSEKIYQILDSNFNDCDIYDSPEGQIVRLFYFDNKWYTSTNKKLDAFKSKWASKESFGDSFVKALSQEVESNESLHHLQGDNILQNFQKTLDKSKQYIFLVLHNEENRVVCYTPHVPTLLHVGTFVNKNEISMKEDIGIPYPEKLKFESLDDLMENVEYLKIMKSQGVIVFSPGNRPFKIVSEKYKTYFENRGNEPSLKYRYLQVRMDGHKMDMLYNIYPDFATTFDKIENDLYDIAKYIYNAYIQRYIKKNWNQVSKLEFEIIKECHLWHDQDRKTNRISLDKVIEVMNTQNPSKLNKMIHEFDPTKETKKIINKKPPQSFKRLLTKNSS